MKTLVMGIVNVTPDSFSDGGKYFSPAEAVRRAKNMLDEGAAIIDVGGESTRPGAEPVSWKDEWGRIGAVVEELAGICGKRGALLSVDTYHPETAKLALDAGAGMINCVYPEPVEEMASLCAAKGAFLVAPAKANVPEDFPRNKLYLDPMVGFGTTREEDLALLKSIPELAAKGNVLVGASRKRIVKKLTGEKTTGKNVGGNLGIAIWCAMNGASAVRVHDVQETFQALKVLEALA